MVVSRAWRFTIGGSSCPPLRLRWCAGCIAPSEQGCLVKLARFDLFGMLFAIVAWLPTSAANAAEPKPAAEPSVRQTSPPMNDNQANKAQQLLQRAKQTLSQVEGTIRLPGLKEPVEILRDRWGIPHIYAKNQHDLFFAQGF